MCYFRFGDTIGTATVVFASLSLCLGAFSGDECITPSGGVGVCNVLYKCEPLLRPLIESRSRPQLWTTKLLRSSHCGFEGNHPVVCCPVGVKPKNPNENETTKKHPLRDLLNKSCGTIHTTDRIYGGSAAVLHEFPWMAAIGYRTAISRKISSGFKTVFRCGGSLISSRYVLTAAHCVTNLEDTIPVFVRLGEHNLDATQDCKNKKDCNHFTKDIPIEELIPHPGYSKRQFLNDIALIRLARRVNFVDYIRPICLPLKSEPLCREKAVVTGWGITETGNSSRVLRKVTVPIVPLKKCSNMYSKIRITENQICAGGEDGKDSCMGDSGGPLQVSGVNPSGEPVYTQHGVVSFGFKKCGMKERPGVYTRVARYVDWIVQNMKG